MLDQILKFGYPPVSFHGSNIFCAQGEINSITVDLYDQAKLLLTRPGRPGCSGDPVSTKGFTPNDCRDFCRYWG